MQNIFKVTTQQYADYFDILQIDDSENRCVLKCVRTNYYFNNSIHSLFVMIHVSKCHIKLRVSVKISKHHYRKSLIDSRPHNILQISTGYNEHNFCEYRTKLMMCHYAHTTCMYAYIYYWNIHALVRSYLFVRYKCQLISVHYYLYE